MMNSEIINIVLFLFLEAIQTRYRITNYHYPTFYRELVQETLAACVYNEGTRKPSKLSK